MDVIIWANLAFWAVISVAAIVGLARDARREAGLPRVVAAHPVGKGENRVPLIRDRGAAS